MKIAVVADLVTPVEEGWSRDPRVLASALRDLGHQVSVLQTSNEPAAAHLRQEPALPARPDVVVSLGTSAPIIASVLADSLGVPLAIGLPSDLFGTTPPAVGYGRLLCRHLASAMLVVECDRHAILAERLAADLHKVFVIPPGVHRVVAPANPGSRCGSHTRVLFDASRVSLDDQRFMERALRCLVAERHRRLHTVVLITGADTDDRLAEMKDLWQGRGETTMLILSGRSPTDDIFASSDIVVVPSFASDESATVIRAMAAGRTLVAVDCPPVQDFVCTARNGILARFGCMEEWIDKLDYVLSAPSLRVHIGRSARQHVATQFSLRRTTREWEVRLGAVTASWRYGTANTLVHGEEDGGF